MLLTKTFDLESGGADLEDSLSTAYTGMAEATTKPKYICLPLAAVDEKRRKNEAIELEEIRKDKFQTSISILLADVARDMTQRVASRH